MKWSPLPKIVHAVAIYPYTPPNGSATFLPTLNSLPAVLPVPTTSTSATSSPRSSRPPKSDSYRSSAWTATTTTSTRSDGSQGDTSSHAALEIGDDLYIFERRGPWYRGYVLRALADGTAGTIVGIGVFPETSVHVREMLDDVDISEYLEERRLAEEEEREGFVIKEEDEEEEGEGTVVDEGEIVEVQLEEDINHTTSEITVEDKDEEDIAKEKELPKTPRISISDPDGGMDLFEVVNGNDEDEEHEEEHEEGEDADPTTPTQANTPKYSTFELSVLTRPSHPPPPLPLGRFDDTTTSGVAEPLVDEISSCIREWNSLLYSYLLKSNYALFHSIKERINVLFQTRRQLMAQTLSKDELGKLRRETVRKMSDGNLMQGLEMIARHPDLGYLLDARNTSLPKLFRIHLEIHLGALSAASSSQSPTSLSLPSVSAPVTPSSRGYQNPATSAALAGVGSGAGTGTVTKTGPGIGLGGGGINNQTLMQSTKSARFHHLYFDFRALVAYISSPAEQTELYFSLYNHANGQFITEEFLIVLNYQGMPRDESKIGKLRTLFTELGTGELGSQIWMVCRIIRTGGMKMEENSKVTSPGPTDRSTILFGAPPSTSGLNGHSAPKYNSDSASVNSEIGRDNNSVIGNNASTTTNRTSHFPIGRSNSDNSPPNLRRPFGCAVLRLGDLLTTLPSTPNGPAKELIPGEHFLPIYTPTSESVFHTLHRDIIEGNEKQYEKNPRAEAIKVYLKLFWGELENIRGENMTLLSVAPDTRVIGFPDVVFPGHTRDELYFKLVSADFTSFGRHKSYQIILAVRDNTTGEIIDGALFAAAGVEPATYWESMVFWHEQKPAWDEGIKIQLPEGISWGQVHIFVAVRHRSSNGKGGSGPASVLENLSNNVPESPGTPGFPGPHNGLERHSTMPLGARGSISSTAGGSDKDSGLLAFGFLPFLVGNGRTFVADGNHELVMYRYDRAVGASTSMYLGAAWKQRNGTPVSGSGSSSGGRLIPLRDVVTVNTFLCSTRYTQNEILLSLLDWETLLEANNGDGGEDELRRVLDKFAFVGEMEIVKFLQDIFDALFGILSSKRNPWGELDDLVLKALVTILGIIQDRRFQNFRPVLDVYIDRHFSFGDAWNHLVRSLVRLLTDHETSGSRAKELRAAIKVWEFLFRFIVRSYEIQIKEQRNQNLGTLVDQAVEQRKFSEEIFKKELYSLLRLVNDIMNVENPGSMIGTQTLALQHFAFILNDLTRVFDAREMVDIIVKFVDAAKVLRGKLVVFKLVMILNVVRGDVFKNYLIRRSLVEHVIRWVGDWVGGWEDVVANANGAAAVHSSISGGSGSSSVKVTKLQWHENLRIAISILAEVLDCARGQAAIPSSQPDDEVDDETDENRKIVLETLSLLPKLIDAYYDLQVITAELANITITSPTISPRSPDAEPTESIAMTLHTAGPPFTFPSTYPFPVIAKTSSASSLPSAIVTGLADLASLLLELFHLTPWDQVTSYLESFYTLTSSNKTRTFLMRLCGVGVSILGYMTAGNMIKGVRPFPSNWLNLNVVAHQIVLCNILVPVSVVLAAKYSPMTRASIPIPSSTSRRSSTHSSHTFVTPNNPGLPLTPSPASSSTSLLATLSPAIIEDEGTHNARLELWRTFFEGLLMVLTSPDLLVESFLQQRQRSVWKIIGDLRGEVGAKLLSKMWEVVEVDILVPEAEEDDKNFPKELKSQNVYQEELVPTIIAPVLELCLSAHDPLRSSAIVVFFNMILVDYAVNGNIETVEQFAIQKLDELIMSRGKGDDVARLKFIKELTVLFDSSDIEPAVLEIAIQLVESISKFLELLLQVRDLPDLDEYKDERIMATLKLMKFIKLIEREEIYIKYVNELVNLQLESHNYVEAALTVKFHADLLPWDPDEIREAIDELGFCEESSFVRKEKLYLQMLEYLEKGKAWEMCIDVCKELAREYECTVFEYGKLANMLKTLAGFYDSIINKERYFTEYFRVGFYGRGFPSSIRNKQFIYRGFEWEKISSFIERLQNRHPNAKLITTAVSDDQINSADSNAQFLHVAAVTPEPDREGTAVFVNERVGEAIRSYYQSNEVCMFSYSKPILQPTSGSSTGASDPTKPENEFLNLWTEKTILTTEDTFPTILRRSEVISIRIVELSPIENAVHAMENKNKELLALAAKYGAYVTKGSTTSINVNPFTMALNGAVDAPVNGGVPMYKKAFLENSREDVNIDDTLWLDRLKEAIDEQVSILDQCLDIHGKLVSADMKPLHDTLVKFFKKNFSEEIKRLPVRRSTYAQRPSIRNSKGLSIQAPIPTPPEPLQTPTISTLTAKRPSIGSRKFSLKSSPSPSSSSLTGLVPLDTVLPTPSRSSPNRSPTSSTISRSLTFSGIGPLSPLKKRNKPRSDSSASATSLDNFNSSFSSMVSNTNIPRASGSLPNKEKKKWFFRARTGTQ